MIDYAPIDGGGSCARCRDRLGLHAQKRGGEWYCSGGCAEGRVSAEQRRPAVPEPWLYARPRRHFRARKPKELKAVGARRSR